MSLLLIEGFDDHYASGSSGVPHGWLIGSLSFNTSYGRFGSIGGASNTNIYYALSVPVNELIVGIAGRANTLGVGTTAHFLILLQGSDSQSHLSITVSSGGAIELRRGNAGATIIQSSSPGLVQKDAYHYYELKATLADTGGTAVVRLDGVEVINYTGDTRASGSATQFDKIVLNGDWYWNYDDLYLCDTSGGAPYNDFLGDVRVQTIFPNGNGTNSQGTGSDANSVDNYALVDEGPAPSGTDYVDLTATEKDTYAYQDASNFANDATIHAVQINSHVLKTDTGTVNAATVAKLGANELAGTSFIPGTTSGYYKTIHETKPGGGAWTTTDVNDAEFGIEAS